MTIFATRFAMAPRPSSFHARPKWPHSAFRSSRSATRWSRSAPSDTIGGGPGARRSSASRASNGKTSTKDLLKAALSRAYTVHATTGQSQQPHRRSAHAARDSRRSGCRGDRDGHEPTGRGRDPARIIAEPDIARRHIDRRRASRGPGRSRGSAARGGGCVRRCGRRDRARGAARDRGGGAAGKAKRVDRRRDSMPTPTCKPDRWEIGPDGLGRDRDRRRDRSASRCAALTICETRCSRSRSRASAA